MTAYIIGMAFGSVFLAIGLAYVIFLMFKDRSLRKLIKDIGQKAEDKINGDIGIWSKHTKNKFIPASLFKYDENKVFEVDSIIITDKAIIVVEIKSIRGGIKGDSNDANWSKVLGEKSFPIKNPIIQNDKHIKHIVKMTSVKVPMISLIIFSNRSGYIDVQNKPGHVVLAREVDLFNTLDNINQSLERCLSSNEIINIYKIIKRFQTTSRKDMKFHKGITTNKSKPKQQKESIIKPKKIKLNKDIDAGEAKIVNLHNDEDDK